MSASALMSLGTRALSANYAALQSTGNNIANANTAGYSRQTTIFETAGGQYTGAGFFGRGVNVTTVERAHSDYLTSEAATSAALAAGDDARSTQLQQLEKVFQTGEAGIGYAAGQVLNAFVDVANKPTDTSARQVVLARAGELAARFSAAGEQIESIQSGVNQDLKVDVAAINGLTSQIATLNEKISATQGSGHQPNDLLDQRDMAVNKLSSYVQVTTIGADDGTMSVFLGGGQSVVLGNQAKSLVVVPDDFDASRVHIGMTETNGVRTMPDALISGGSLSGLMRFQNSDLADARNQLGQLAASIAGAVNQQQALGLNMGNPPTAGAPIFSNGTPAVVPSTGNATVAGVPVASMLDASGNRVATVGLSIVSPSELRASDYELSADSAGGYQLTRLSDGNAQAVVNGDVVDGFKVNIASPLPVAGDRFLLRPVGEAALNMSRLLDDPKGIAAASPVAATLAAANTGTASVASLSATSSSLNPNLTATITFTNNAGAYSVSLVDSTGALPTTTTPGTWTAGQPIQINGWSMQLNGVPRSGDVINVAKTAFTNTDNGNANAMIALRDATLVGSQPSANVPGDSVTDAYANLIANVGVRVQSAQLAATQSATVAADAKAAVTSKTGVNLDEEAARLMQYQQSYQAAAKMLQVAQSVFQTLLQMAGGG